MSGRGKIAALIVHFFAPDAALACVRSLLAGTRPPDRVVLLDNGSIPGSLEALRRAVPSVEIVASPRNLGFAGALGPSRGDLAPGGALLVLNQDCELDARCVELLETALAAPGVGIACPTVLDRQGRVWAQGGRLGLSTGRHKNDGMGGLPRTTESPVETGYAPGCALLITSALWRRLGGMHARYFMYAEDADLAARARRRGLRVVCETRAVCHHEGSASSGAEHAPFQSYFRLRNRAIFVRRNATVAAQWLFAAIVLPLLVARDALRYARLQRLRAYVEVLRGLLDVSREADPPRLRQAGSNPRGAS